MQANVDDNKRMASAVKKETTSTNWGYAHVKADKACPGIQPT